VFESGELVHRKATAANRQRAAAHEGQRTVGAPTVALVPTGPWAGRSPINRQRRPRERREVTGSDGRVLEELRQGVLVEHSLESVQDRRIESRGRERRVE